MSDSVTRSAARGPHAVGVISRQMADPHQADRRLPIEVWFPAERDQEVEEAAEHPLKRPHRAIANAVPKGGAFPLVAFSHGNSGLRHQSTFLTTHLASWGMVVAAPDHVGNTIWEMSQLRSEDERIQRHLDARRNRPRDIANVIDHVLAGDAAFAAADPERVAVLGHSYGGWTSLKLPRIDARIRAVCALAPASEPFVGKKAFEPDELPLPADLPSLLVVAMDDVLIDLQTSVRPLFERLDAPRALVGISDCDHFHFCDGIELLHGLHEANPRPNQPRPTRPLAELLDEGRMHRCVQGVVTAFLRDVLAGGDGVRVLGADELAALDESVRLLDG